MRITLTDEFLLMLYDFYEATNRALEPPEIFKLRGWKAIGVDLHFWKELKRKKSERQFHQFINYLKKSGYIKTKKIQGKKGLLLTSKGNQKVLRAKFKKINSKKLKKRKDGRWVMVVFDIPEKKRRCRDGFRDFLYSWGFQKLQQSVWVSPYDVSRQLEEIIRIYPIDSYIKTFLIKEIEI